MLVTRAEQQRSGYYREWLAYLDIHHMVGAVFPAGDGAVGVLGIHRPASGGAYADAERHKVTLLLPHLQRALRLGRRLADADLIRAAALDVLDRIDTGVIAVDRSGSIVHANAHAEETIRENPQIGVLRGRFYLHDPVQQERYTAMLLGCVATAEGRPPPPAPTALAIGRENRLPLTLAVTPLRPGWTDRGRAPALALVFLRDPERAGLHVIRLRDLFGLTATEAAIAADLGAGKSPEQIARRHHIGIGTVRWHLKSVLAKTGTTRQAEAVALLARSVAALSSRN
jgi:DNA-binding CsgD family transcriptional regulator